MKEAQYEYTTTSAGGLREGREDEIARKEAYLKEKREAAKARRSGRGAADATSQTRDSGVEVTDVEALKLDEVRIRKSSRTIAVRMEDDAAAQAAAGRAHATWESGQHLEKSPSGKRLQKLPSGSARPAH